MILFFYLTTFLSSFLLFTIQLIVGKRLLPWFGGVASIWTTTMLFFMFVLFLGYLYVNFISRFSQKVQVKIHLTLIGISVLGTALNYWQHSSLIFHYLSGSNFSITSPIVQILLLIFFCIGLPFFLLATTSTLLQYWFTSFHPQKSPYPLYVISNVGSLLGLLAYPFLIEPLFSISTQETFWLSLFLIYCFLMIGISRSLFNLQLAKASTKLHSAKSPLLKIIIWLLLSTTSNIALLATTSRITQSISPIPFLWILPLSLFLVSFIVAFGGDNWYSRKFHTSILLFSLIATSYVASGRVSFSYWINLSIILFSLFMISLVCHAELFRSRPKPESLIPFYISISFGGVLASLFCAIIAPLYFSDLWEFPVSLVLATLVCLFIMLIEWQNWVLRFQQLVLGCLVLIVIFIQFRPMFQPVNLDPQTHPIQKVRNFYGVLEIIEYLRGPDNQSRSENNGSIEHGYQYLSGNKVFEPTTYYQRNSGIGFAIDKSHKRESGQPLRIGVIGLGVGTMAAYCQPGDYFRFYEINPAVITLSEKHFTFIPHCKQQGNTIDIVSGDARLSLQKELAAGTPQNFDFLIIDAFTDDSIPAHLLTKEAIKLFLSHLSGTGILAFHISNRYIALDRILDAESASLNLFTNRLLNADSDWYFVSSTQIFKPLAFYPPKQGKDIRSWTDDYSNILQVIK